MAAACVLGVDLGGTKLLAGALDRDLGVRHRALRPVAGLDQARLLDTIVAAVDEVRELSGAEIGAVGFGVPCLIDQRRGVAMSAVNLPIHDLPFRDVMSERLGVPAFIDNDANVAALAEHKAGAARGHDHAVVLTVGTGIGGGLILGGEVYRGAIGAGAELGHMVIEADGPPCQGNCPNRGCLETMASGTALARDGRLAAEADPSSALGRALAEGRPITGTLVTELAHDGDPVAAAVFERVARFLGVGIASFVNIFNPEIVVIGGGVIGAGEMLLGPARDEAQRRVLHGLMDGVEIVPARFGVEAGMVGAGALALDGLERRERQTA